VRKSSARIVIPRLVFAAMAFSVACREPIVSGSPIVPTVMLTPYSAVFLTNGQTFFGKLEKLETEYPVLTDVYYVQTQLNQETKEVTNRLIKRGNEWHAPDRMVLNSQHILFVEPVTNESTVAKLIDELKTKKQ
jgi:hypothetical protein